MDPPPGAVWSEAPRLRFHRAVILADTALALDPECWKAHSRKGLALLELGEFVAARRALRDACACAPEPADQRAVRRELRRLQEREKRAKDGEQRQRRAFSKAMARPHASHDLFVFNNACIETKLIGMRSMSR